MGEVHLRPFDLRLTVTRAISKHNYVAEEFHQARWYLEFLPLLDEGLGPIECLDSVSRRIGPHKKGRQPPNTASSSLSKRFWPLRRFQ